MFDALKGLGGLGDLPGLMAKAQEMQEKMQRFQEESATRQFSAEAGAGMVTAVVNGRMELVRVRIDKDKVDPADTDLLEDLIVAAVVNAQARAATELRDEMAKMQSDLGLPPGMLPGM